MLSISALQFGVRVIKNYNSELAMGSTVCDKYQHDENINKAIKKVVGTQWKMELTHIFIKPQLKSFSSAFKLS